MQAVSGVGSWLHPILEGVLAWEMPRAGGSEDVAEDAGEEQLMVRVLGGLD